MSKCLGNKVRRKHLSAITPSRAIQRNSLVASEAPTHRHAISLALVCCSFVCALVLMLSAGVLFSMCRARANEWMRVRVFQCIAFILFYIYLYSKCMYHFFFYLFSFATFPLGVFGYSRFVCCVYIFTSKENFLLRFRRSFKRDVCVQHGGSLWKVELQTKNARVWYIFYNDGRKRLRETGRILNGNFRKDFMLKLRLKKIRLARCVT